MPELQFLVVGADADAAAAELQATFGGLEVDDGLTLRTLDDADEVLRRGLKASNVIAAATLLLTVPGAVVACLDLTDRIKTKRPRAEAVIRDARELESERQVEIYVVTDQGLRRLSTLTADDLLDVARSGAKEP